jgi:26S proteasome non-ATPase regulatory subunit 10
MHGAWQTNVEGQTPEELEGLGDREQKRVREYVVMQCGKYE